MEDEGMGVLRGDFTSPMRGGERDPVEERIHWREDAARGCWNWTILVLSLGAG